ncbi:MAG TPA: amino acid adenylation domain-containing protein [Candidatus Angelobacter sp.]|nr:amino acid adenylation domain-containing protein [Candidatus Angelobacter sp.]
MDQRANQLANYLRRLGVRQESYVGLWAERSLEMVVGILGILKAGGVYVPVDPSWPTQRKAFVLAETDALLLCTNKNLLAGLETFQGHAVCFDSEWEQISQEQICSPAVQTSPDSLAYVIYTSGTTGKPKGVMIGHRALCSHLRWMQAAFPLTPEDCVPQKYSLSFDVSVLEIFYPLLAGARLAIAPPMEYFDSAGLMSFLIENKITAIDLVPSMLQMLVQDQKFSSLAGLRQVTCGGDILPASLQEEFFAHSTAELANLYGPTEATISSTFWRCRRDGEYLPVPIGRPISNTEVYVLDQYMGPVPVGVAGEIYIGGRGLARGYLHGPDPTAQNFLPHCYSSIPGERLYRTGDLGRYDERGNIEYLGRTDHQLKIRGFRIEPGEIEVVLRECSAVRDAVVVAHEQQLVVYVAGDQPDQNDLRQYLKDRLPEYMLPAHFVWLDRIPVLANGKVDRTALPAPNPAASPRDYVAPRTEMEEILAAIWSAVLKLPPVGVEDNFFELGGDSIISLQVVVRAQQQGIRITPRQLFESRTVAELAAVADRVDDSGKKTTEPGAVEGEVAFTPIQRWFFEQELEEAHHYNQAVLLQAGEELKSEWLETAWKQLVEHHDALRLRYRREQGEWRQRNAGREEKQFFSVMELERNEEEERALETERLIAGMQKGLDLECGPPLRVAHVKPDRLVVVIHHLVVDGVSWRILLEDLESAYRQLSRGEEIQLPSKTTSYQRWSEMLAREAEAGRYKDELEYWLGKEGQAVEKMPKDWEGGENREADRRCVKVELDVEQTRQLLQEVPGVYHTQINDVLLAAVLGAWEKWTGKPRLLIDVEGHGRVGGEEGMDLSRTVGWFTAVYPVRLEGEKGEAIGERLKRTKEQLRKVPRQGVGYGVLRYMNNEEVVEQLCRQPEAEISFNYLGQVDAALPERGLFRTVEALEENSSGGKNRRSHLLQVEGRVQAGRLQVQWIYSQETHRRATIEALANNFVKELGDIIQHCLTPGAGGFTPSDFTLVQFDQHTLDFLMKDLLMKDLLVKGDPSISDIYPLSPIQQGLLFHTLYDGAHSGTYVEQLGCTLEGNVNVRAFEDAWQQVVDCHPVVRTSFAWEGLQEPLQVVHQSARASFTHHDWSQSAVDQQQQLKNLRHADIEQGFDLSRPPLMRFTLVQLAPGRFEFIWSSHHLLLDGWGMSLVLQEVLERYAAMRTGTSFHPATRRPYRDYIAWLQKQDMASAQAYWEASLQDFSVATPLPAERTGQSAIPDQENGEQQLAISGETTAHLQTMTRQHQITLSVLVQAAWALLLRHYTSERDLVFGVTVSGRPAELAGVDRMVGVFINTLPLRLGLSSDATVFSVLKELQTQQLRLNEYAYTPLSKIQEWSEVPPGLPLFETIVVFENYPVDASLKEIRGKQESRELKFSNVRSRASTNYPLTLIAKPGDELALQLTYDAGRFDARMISQLLRPLQNLLVGMAAAPMQRVGDLQVISQTERQQLLVEWNRTVREYPREQCIQQLFEEQARRAPQKIAVVFQDQKLSYEELNRRANQLAHYLKKQGVGSEVRVGLCMERSLEMIVALLGILKAGGAYVALDTGSPEERLTLMLGECRVRVALTQYHLRELLPESPSVQLLCVDAEWESIAGESNENLGMEVSGEQLGYVSYTSGSTGRPKGVSVPHRAVVRLVKGNNYAGLGAEEVMLQFAPLAFDASTLEIWGSLLNGGRLAVMGPGPRSTEEIGQALVDYGVTTLWLTAGLFQVMVDEQLERLKQVRQVLAGGDVLSVGHVNRYLAAMEEGAVLINGYGPTENTTFTCCHQMRKGEVIGAKVPIGRPIGNTQVYVLDEEMQPVAVGVMGELYMGGEGLGRGYENDMGLTAEKFIPHLYGKAGERLYRSGDMVRYLDDGVLEFVGRKDRQVKVRGYRVEPGEIEWALMQHEGVREAVVAVQENERGEKSLIAYVVMQPDQNFSTSDLQIHLKDKIPDYMQPSTLVPLEKLPLTANGKVDYQALPRPEILGESGGFVLPRTPVEHAVAEIWRQAFGIQKLSVDDNFFQLGGHSLLALQIASRVRTVLGAALPLRSIFEEPTIADQARTVERLLGSGQTAASAGIRPSTRPDNLPLSFAQQRLWLLHQLEPTSDFYNIPIVLRIRGPLNVNILGNCCNEIMRRHEVLRTTFPIRQGAPVQQIAAAVGPPLAVTDLGHLPLEQAEATARELMSREAERPFDLSCGPLLRPSLLRLAKDEHVLLLNMHHIIVDGWSLGILMREMAVLYEAFLARRSSPLPPLSIQYADYTLWQREWLSGELLGADLTYWRQQLSGTSALALPTDRPRPKVQTFRGAKRSILLSPQVLDRLKELARRESSTLFMTLLAALKVLLYRYTGQAEITVGTPVAGRNQREIELLIGFFVNTLALRSRVFGHPRFVEFLRQVREISLGAYAHQDLPFDKLVEELHPQRDPSSTPFFQVMFALEDMLPQELALAGLQMSPIEIEGRTAKFDLTLTIRETSHGLSISFEYNSGLFEDATAERMTNHFQRLLWGIASDPKQQISEISLLAEEERRQMLMEWNHTEHDWPIHETVLELLEAQARESPEALAVMFEGKRLVYRELHERANQLARFLRKLGVGPEVPVGVCMERSEKLVIALLGILKAGGAYVPLDPSYPAERLNYILNDAECGVLLVGDGLKEKLPDVGARLVCLEDEWQAISAESREAVESKVGGENLVYVIYTSGSTGQPKGVMNIHRGLLNRLQWGQEAYDLDESDRVLQKTPFGFDISVWEFFWPLMYGACLVVARPEGHKDSQYLVRTIQQERITTLHFVPSMLQVFLQEPGLEDCASLRRIISSGEALSREVVQKFHDRLPVELHNLYGPTEASIEVSFWPCRGQQEGASIPIGRPIANSRLYVLDSYLQPVPVGVAGELYIGGVALARGYWRRAGLTAEKFIPNPFSSRPGERLYQTGDMARRWAGGELEYLGRLDNQVKLRGHRIELDEIRAVLRQHAEVSQAVVVLGEDPSGEKRLVAYVVPKNGADQFCVDDVRDYLKTKLPGYMVPPVMVLMDEIPLTANGKIDYNILPLASSIGPSATHLYVAPRNAIEEQIAKACCDLLGVQRMGIHDDFFDLGGHSLLAMRLMTWVRETFQVEAASLRGFFETPTVAGLAALTITCEARPGQTEKIAKFLQQLDAMSPEEVMTLRTKHMAIEAAQNAVSKN